MSKFVSWKARRTRLDANWKSVVCHFNCVIWFVEQKGVHHVLVTWQKLFCEIDFAENLVIPGEYIIMILFREKCASLIKFNYKWNLTKITLATTWKIVWENMQSIISFPVGISVKYRSIHWAQLKFRFSDY